MIEREKLEKLSNTMILQRRLSMTSMIDLEYKALETKERNPTETVICPRCGKELLYREVGNSYEIKCLTEVCLKMTVRGL